MLAGISVLNCQADGIVHQECWFNFASADRKNAYPKGNMFQVGRRTETPQATKGDDSVTWIGRVKWKVAPPPLLALAHNCPPCDSTMERLMANPMPLPCGLVVKNAEKIRSIFSVGNPTPVSLTENWR